MGLSQSILKPAVLAEITEHTNFSDTEAKDLYRLFQKEALANGRTCCNLNKESFIHIFAQGYPGMDCEKFATQIFRVFDKDHSGDIDFREFLIGLDLQLTSDPEVKTLNAYSYLDIHNKGIITYQGTIEAIQGLYDLNTGYLPLEDVVDAEKYAERIFMRAGRKEQGTMNLPAFKNVVKESVTARSLVEGINRAASRPYVDRKDTTGSIGRKRATSVMVRKPSQKASRKMRTFTV